MGRLIGKTALITAAAQGIGKATAEAFIKEGATVIGVDINENALTEVKGIIPIKMDITLPNAGIELAAQFPNVNILYNCAGIVHGGSILECSDEDMDFAYKLNVSAMFRMIKAFLPNMIKNGGGSIINMSSIASSVKGIPNRFAYCATKAAVIGITKSVAADFVKDKIRCNAICPGTVDTPSLRQRLADTGDFDKAYKDFCERQAMGRLGNTDELAALAVYLGSDESGFTTGHSHVIDGGWIM